MPESEQGPLDFRGTLAYLMDRLGKPVLVVVGSVAEDAPPLVAQMSGTLAVAWDEQAAADDRLSGAVMFSFIEHESTFCVDEAAFQTAEAGIDALSASFGSVTLKVSDLAAAEAGEADGTAADPAEPTSIPPASPHPLRLAKASETGGPSSAGAAEAGTSERPSKRQSPIRRFLAWSNTYVLAAVIAALLAAGIVALVREITQKKPPPDGPTKIERLGDVDGPFHIRVVKQAGVRNSYAVEDRVAHNIQTIDVYNCSVGHYPVQFDVSEAEYERLVDSDGKSMACPAATQPKITPRRITGHYVLREQERPGKPLRSWAVVDGQRVPIPDDDTFNCLVKRYLAWDQVSEGEIRSFPLHKSRRAARCSA